jgi:hypothetical protein
MGPELIQFAEILANPGAGKFMLFGTELQPLW